MPDQFLDFSTTIVKDFLQTAVILDEQSIFETPEQVKEVITPLGYEEDTQHDEKPETPSLNKNSLRHNLDAKEILNSFTGHGIVCSILKPESKSDYEEKKEHYIKLMKKADIVVLDWNLFGDGGERITELINDALIATTSALPLNELRLIIIYSADNLEEIKSKLKEISICFDEDKYSSSSQNHFTYISLYNKPDSLNAVSNRTVPFNNLIDICIREFTKQFHGIIPNVAMAAISKIRQSTHQILGVLNKTLDPAYLSHRALLPHPEDAEIHLEEIIASEIESIIYSSQVGKQASYNNIKNTKILENIYYQGIDLKQLIQTGIDGSTALNSSKKKTAKDHAKNGFTSQWYPLKEESQKSEMDFAKLTLLRRNYLNHSIHLQLGVIIQEKIGDNPRTYLCLQPKG